MPDCGWVTNPGCVAPLMAYEGRPGVSPALAVLVALGHVKRSQAIVDVGCGTGTDALTLASWGFRRVVGIDPDAKAIATARQRAKRRNLKVRFEALRGEDLEEAFGPRRFDVALHTLVANNLRQNRRQHFHALAKVLRPEGLLVLHERVARRYENASPGGVVPLPEAKQYFRLTPSVSTHLAEHSGLDGGHAIVALWLGRPR